MASRTAQSRRTDVQKRQDRDVQFIQLALRQAKCAQSRSEVPVGAVLVRGDRVIARGFNLRESRHTVLGHAELDVLQKASKKLKSWRLAECELFVTLEPCPMCLAAIQQARIRRVVYGARDLKGGAHSLGYYFERDPNLHHQMEVEFLSVAECGLILSRFFKELRSKKAIRPKAGDHGNS